jgi:hypothetical protein
MKGPRGVNEWRRSLFGFGQEAIAPADDKMLLVNDSIGMEIW